MDGYLDEDAVQALEQVVSERLNFARPASERWRTADDGMHVLAAALYRLMQETGFAANGGTFETWLGTQVTAGHLSPPEVERLAASVVGTELIARWKSLGK
jgi:hypothetical protein